MERDAEGGRGANIMLQHVPVGARLELGNGCVAEVTDNPRDGAWIFVRYVSCPDDPGREATEELVFCLDVVQVL